MTESTLATPARTSQVVHIGTIRNSPHRNISRGGVVAHPGHPEVKRLVESIKMQGGLLEPVGVRELPFPVLRPLAELEADPEGPREFRYELVFGFRRIAALQVLGQKMVPCVMLGPMSDIDADNANIAENGIRHNPSDYDDGVLYATLLGRDPNLTFTELARRMQSREYRVETLVAIITRIPKEILDQFRNAPSVVNKNALARIAKLQGPTPEDTKRMMMDAWDAFQNPPDAPVDAPEVGHRIPSARVGRAMGRKEIEALRAQIDQSTQFLDMGDWRPITQEARTAMHAVLRRAADPKANRSPVR